MRNRRVYKILSLLEEEETKEFQAYLVSPLFGESNVLLRFFQLWQERILQAKDEMEPEAFLAGSGFQVARLDKLCSQLHRKCVDFLALKAYQDSPSMTYRSRFQAFDKRGAPEDEYRRQYERYEKELKQQKDSGNRRLEEL